MAVQGYPVHRFRPYPQPEPTLVPDPDGGDGFYLTAAVPGFCSWCAALRDDPVHRDDLGRTTVSAHPGMAPKRAGTPEEEHAALLRRIKEGHAGVEFVPIGGSDVRAERGQA